MNTCIEFSEFNQVNFIKIDFGEMIGWDIEFYEILEMKSSEIYMCNIILRNIECF
jgi:hypothetical protein